MRTSFITSVPDKSGAFLKAVRIFSSLNLNIVRTSYNKAVDSHLIFLEVDGREEEIDKARQELKNLGYWSSFFQMNQEPWRKCFH